MSGPDERRLMDAARMTDLQRGGSNRMRGARDPHVHGRVGHGRELTLLSEREQWRRLPDFECQHGRLEGDPSPACGCFFREAVEELRFTALFQPACSCGDLNVPNAMVCVGCGRKLGVTV